MSGEGGGRPVFVDTSAFYARADADDAHHDEVMRLFDGIRGGELPFRPLYTSQAVCAEFATLALYKLGHETAARALGAIRASASITILPVGTDAFAAAAAQFTDYDDQQISFVDHTTGVLAADRDVEHVVAFDSDFRTLGFALVPADVRLPE
jgi:predicted nucleic acid-binding protein